MKAMDSPTAPAKTAVRSIVLAGKKMGKRRTKQKCHEVMESHPKQKDKTTTRCFTLTLLFIAALKNIQPPP